MPPTLATLNNLSVFEVRGNNLEGCFPMEYATFCDLEFIRTGFIENPNLPGEGDFEAFCADDSGSCEEINEPEPTNCAGIAQSKIPRSFAPNSQIQANRQFDPLSAFEAAACPYPENTQLTILNRWGEVIFKPELYEPWDGTNNGEYVLANTYYYILKNEKENVIRGAINVVYLKE